jgi:hypothetical protein
MIESSDFRLTKMPLNNRAGHMPALGFGTLIPDHALTRTATRDEAIGRKHRLIVSYEFVSQSRSFAFHIPNDDIAKPTWEERLWGVRFRPATNT